MPAAGYGFAGTIEDRKRRAIRMPPVVEKKPKADSRQRKRSWAFYLSQGLVEDIARISRETGRSKSEVLELLAQAGLELHRKKR